MAVIVVDTVGNISVVVAPVVVMLLSLLLLLPPDAGAIVECAVKLLEFMFVDEKNASLSTKDLLEERKKNVKRKGNDVKTVVSR